MLPSVFLWKYWFYLNQEWFCWSQLSYMVVDGGRHRFTLSEFHCRFSPKWAMEGGRWLYWGRARTADATTVTCTGFSAVWWTVQLFPHPALPMPIANSGAVCLLWLCFLNCVTSWRGSPAVCYAGSCPSEGLVTCKVGNKSAKMLKSVCNFAWLTVYICCICTFLNP